WVGGVGGGGACAARRAWRPDGGVWAGAGGDGDVGGDDNCGVGGDAGVAEGEGDDDNGGCGNGGGEGADDGVDGDGAPAAAAGVKPGTGPCFSRKACCCSGLRLWSIPGKARGARRSRGKAKMACGLRVFRSSGSTSPVSPLSRVLAAPRVAAAGLTGICGPGVCPL